MLRVYPVLRELLCAEFKKADKNFDDARLSFGCSLNGVHAAYYAGEGASAIVGGIDHGKYEKTAAQNGYVNVTFLSADLYGFLPAFTASLSIPVISYSLTEDELFSPVRYCATRLLMFSQIAGNAYEDCPDSFPGRKDYPDSFPGRKDYPDSFPGKKDCPDSFPGKKDCPDSFPGNLGYFPQDSQVRDSLFRLYSLAEPLPNNKLANRAKSVSAQLLALFESDSIYRTQRLIDLMPLAIAGAKVLFAVDALLQPGIEEGNS